MHSKIRNLRRPWLPQSYPPPQPRHPNLEREIEEAKKLVKKTGQRIAVLRRKHMALQKKLVGPYTVEMINVTGQYVRAKQERRAAIEKFRSFRTIMRLRMNGKAK